MTEKRFQWVYIKDNLLELRDNGIVKVFNNERLEELLNELYEENQQLKHKLFCKQFDNLELKPHNCKCKVELNDIIGIVKTDEPTNSVKLKKELYK